MTTARIPYDRIYNVYPTTATAARVAEISAKAFAAARSTVGGSYDDAGIGDGLSSKTAICWDIPQADRQNYINYFKEHYPGTIVKFDGTGGSVVPPVVVPPIVVPPIVVPPVSIRMGVNMLHRQDLINLAHSDGCRSFLCMDGYSSAQAFARQYTDSIFLYRKYMTGYMSPADFIQYGLEGVGNPPPNFYILGMNEGDILPYGEPAQMQVHYDWDIDVATRIKAIAPNAKYYAGSFSVGTPDFTRQDVCDKFRATYSAAYNAGKFGIDWHTYSPTPDHIYRTDGDQIWYETRYEMAVTKCGLIPSVTTLINGGTVNLMGIVSGETGLDVGGKGGFPGCGLGSTEIGNWCKQYVVVTQKNYPGLLRAGMLFTVSGNGWDSYAVDGAFPNIGASNK